MKLAILLSALVHVSVADLCAENFTLEDLPRSLMTEGIQLLLGGALDFLTSCRFVEYEHGKTKLLLYTRNNPDVPIELNNSRTADLRGRFTIMIAHGFLCSSSNGHMPDLKDAYLKRYDRNVVMVDWSYYSRRYYSNCYCNLPRIAEEVASFLCRADRCGNDNINNIHFVGHSMGGQLAGLVGQEVKRLCKKTLGRISGLDPAGPLYVGLSKSKRLDASDAMTVMVIHTNKGTLGYPENCGTVDFYANGGASQPGCSIANAPVAGVLNQAVYPIHCSHIRAVTYMIESISSRKFKGRSCLSCSSCIFDPYSKSYGIMGEDLAADEVPCSYYVKTNSKPPYAIG